MANESVSKSCLKFLLAVFLLFLSVESQAQTKSEAEEKSINIEQSEEDQLWSLLDDIAEQNEQGNIEEARQMLRRAQAKADSLNDPALLQAVEKELGDHYLVTNKIDSAKTVLQRAAEREGSTDMQIQVLNLLATAHRYQSDYEESLNSYNRALALVDSTDHADYIAAINANKASVFENLGDYSQAISLYQDAIEFAEAEEDSSFLATALNNLGNLYNNREEYEESIPYLEESIAISEEQDFRLTKLRAFTNLGNTHRELGNYEEAARLYDEALALHRKQRPGTPPFQIRYNMGRLYFERGELQRAEEAFRESMELSEKMGIPDGRFYNLMALADLAEERGDMETAISRTGRALQTANEMSSAPFRIDAAEKLYQLNKRTEDFTQALEYHELFKSVSDSLNEEQQDVQLATAETELGLRRQQQINRLLEERQEQQQARIATQNWLIGTSVVVLAVVLSILYLLYRSNLKRRRANEKLEQQQKKLEELNKVKDKILAILAHDLRSPLASIKAMIYLFRENELSSEEIQKMASKMEISVDQNITMLDNLLAWAQDQMSGLKISTKKINAADIVDEVRENYELQSSQKAINLISRVDGEVSVQADEDLLRLILRNLISNGIKFSGEGSRVVIEHRQEPDKVYFTIRDNGVGIPDEKVDTLFSGDFESQKGTQNEKGSGLGLRLVHEFVDKLGGELSIESKKGEGTAVTFSLPKA